MNKLISRVDTALERTLVVLMGIMVVTVTWQVTTRYLLNSPSSYTEELANYLLIWISLLGACYALRVKAHLGIDILTRNLSGTRKRIATNIVSGAVIVFASAICIYGGIRLVYVTLKLNQVSAAFQVPVGYVYLVLPLSGVLMILYALHAMLNADADESDAVRAMVD